MYRAYGPKHRLYVQREQFGQDSNQCLRFSGLYSLLFHTINGSFQSHRVSPTIQSPKSNSCFRRFWLGCSCLFGNMIWFASAQFAVVNRQWFQRHGQTWFVFITEFCAYKANSKKIMRYRAVKWNTLIKWNTEENAWLTCCIIRNYIGLQYLWGFLLT